MSISSYALTVFVTVEVVNLAAIGVDYLLIKDGLPAITEVATKYPAIGVLITLFQAVQPVAIALHFWYYPQTTSQSNNGLV